MTIEIDTAEMQRLADTLERFNKRAVPFATRNTLNRAAFDARKEWRKLIRKEFTNRVNFTQDSIRVDRARGLNLKTQESRVGSIAPYMRAQEEGAVRTKKGSEGVPIATPYAASQNRQKARTKPVTAANKLSSVKLNHVRGRKGSRAAQNTAKIKAAAASRRRYVFLDLGRRKGIFKVIGGPKYNRIMLVHDLTRTSVTTKPTRMLERVIDAVTPRLPAIHVKSLEFQFNRMRK